ncbi:farnesyl diphosphate synthase [Amylostereum chailletii]|nr:farnesyl diphosphate synthase [Amylostereum chailletii]
MTLPLTLNTRPTGDEAPSKVPASARERFQKTYASLKQGIPDYLKYNGLPEDVLEYYTRSIDYNLPGGKQHRGVSVFETASLLVQRELSDEEHARAIALGWAIELVRSPSPLRVRMSLIIPDAQAHAYCLVIDDMMDQSITRRGKPCWYHVEGVGSRAINDAGIIKGAIFNIVRTHFRTQSYYSALVDILHDSMQKTVMGQTLDLITAPEDDVDLSKFSLDRHKIIVIFKTSLYSFYLPIALALVICGFPMTGRDWWIRRPDVYKLAFEILVPLGNLFQIQDDYIDYAGTPKQIGKVGTDIVDNKCSWCIATALALASPEQRAILDASYGRKDAAAEARVKEVYREVGLDRVYAEYEERTFGRIEELVDQLSDIESPSGGAVLTKEVFRSYIAKIYNRSK